MKHNPVATNRLIVSAPPFIKTGETNHCLMFDVFIASLPLVLLAVYFFGPSALLVIALTVFAAVATEAVIQIIKAPVFRFRPFLYNFITNEKITIMDGSAIVTGLLLAFNLPPQVPFWLPVIGGIVAIALGKQIFGGLGHNIFNPALFARVFLVAAWPAHMTSFVAPFDWGKYWGQLSLSPQTWTIDAVSAATPLAKHPEVTTPYWDLFVGGIGGSIGETSALAILLGGAYLLYKGTITWHTPFAYLGTVAVMAGIFGQDPLFHLLSGGLMLGAFFMATDVVTSPVTKRGRIVFGIGCGIITVLIRTYGAYPEGVSYSILLMNACTPLIDKYSATRLPEARLQR